MEDFKSYFLEEAYVLLDQGEQQLLESDVPLARNEAFLRTLHTLKGNAGMFEFHDMAQLAHALESWLAEPAHATEAPAQTQQLLLKALDAMRQNLKGADIPAALLDKIRAATTGEAPTQGSAADDLILAAHAETQTVRLKLDQLYDITEQTENILAMQARLGQLARELGSYEIAGIAEQLERAAVRLRETAQLFSMAPLRMLSVRFSRAVQDLAAHLNKPLKLATTGLDTQVDRGVLERLTAPLIHLIRNAADHGIETTEERKAAGKPAEGTLAIHVRDTGGLLELVVEDDGRGIDTEKLKKKAIQLGLLHEGDTPDARQLMQLLFVPGFSTAQLVSEVSGRGVGLDAVKKEVEAMNGRVEIESQPGRGTRFIILLPLTLSMGLVVEAGAATYFLPLSAVESCITVTPAERQKMCLQWNDMPIPYIDLNTRAAEKLQPAVVLRDGDSRAALMVDRILGSHQALIRPLGRVSTGSAAWLGGATVLNDGTVALVADTHRLIQMELHMAQQPAAV